MYSPASMTAMFYAFSIIFNIQCIIIIIIRVTESESDTTCTMDTLWLEHGLYRLNSSSVLYISIECSSYNCQNLIPS